ncbi:MULTISPECIES: ABC transporter permease [Actinoalloteichus]|uniref:FtsX-like permease family n=1 Tax=Actinoalloteichus fjordicus TaxID=1612552 RepID=A0AAC9PV94_9PSEU|nr:MULTISPECIES: ABC transporter permease [Actinoalloteichus]APU17721.1 FtsX-like permease family [Actinoalloteichus fjordicus]APU23799.1 FtsX-like permease family [Actinoalloteichus sp. GBA129-24]
MNGDRRGVLRRWAQDLALGVRLAVGGSRTPWGRISLTAIGAGLGVAVLLLLASAGSVVEQRAARESARAADRGFEITDPSTALHIYENHIDHGGTQFRAFFVDVAGNSPEPPPGVERLPGPGEIVASPALAELLNSPDGAGLSRRLGDEVVGVIGRDGLLDPHEVIAYVGTDQLSDRSPDTAVRGFNLDGWVGFGQITPTAMIILLVGVAVMVVPVVVFVASSTRLAEAARDRRLAALRLVGADAGQVRRIAAGEALLGAVGGLIVGFLAFFPARVLLEQISILEFGVFASDLVPAWWAVLAIVIGLPAVAVTTAVAAMRRTVIEPLGVVRRTRPVRRRLWWRLVPVVAGAVGMVYANPRWASDSVESAALFSLSVALLLIGVPALLPWLVERAVARLRGGPLPWQLAVRRLQLDSGTAARAVSGVAVILAGMIGLQTIVATSQAEVRANEAARAERLESADHSDHLIPQSERGLFSVYSDLDDSTEPSFQDLVAALAAEPAVDDMFVGWTINLMQDVGGYQRRDQAVVADCEQLAKLNALPFCEPGDSFVLTDQEGQDRPDGVAPIVGEHFQAENNPDYGRSEFTIPADAQSIPWSQERFFWMDYDAPAVLLTPEAAGELPPLDLLHQRLIIAVDPTDRDAAEAALIAVSDVDALAQVADLGRALPTTSVSAEQQTLDTILLALLVAGVLTFSLIGSSLLVVAIEQIGERRRPLAVISAVGAPRRTLAISVLLQTVIPVAAGLVIAAVIGVTMAVLTLLPSEQVPRFSLTGIGLMALAALIVTVIVTLCTLSSLRRATRPEELRTE